MIYCRKWGRCGSQRAQIRQNADEKLEIGVSRNGMKYPIFYSWIDCLVRKCPTLRRMFFSSRTRIFFWVCFLILRFARLYKSEEGLRNDIEREIAIKFYLLYLWDRSIIDEYPILKSGICQIDRNDIKYSVILIWIQRGTREISVESGCPHYSNCDWVFSTMNVSWRTLTTYLYEWWRIKTSHDNPFSTKHNGLLWTRYAWENNFSWGKFWSFNLLVPLGMRIMITSCV